MHGPRQPALLFYRLVCLHGFSLDRAARIASCLLNSLFDQDLEDLHDAFQILHGRDGSLVSQQAPCNLSRHSSTGRVRLSMQQWDE